MLISSMPDTATSAAESCQPAESHQRTLQVEDHEGGDEADVQGAGPHLPTVWEEQAADAHQGDQPGERAQIAWGARIHSAQQQPCRQQETQVRERVDRLCPEQRGGALAIEVDRVEEPHLQPHTGERSNTSPASVTMKSIG